MITFVAVSVVATIVLSALAGRFALTLARVTEGWHEPTALAGAGGGPPFGPAPAATDVASSPLGTPAPVASPSDKYAFAFTQDDRLRPIAWSPCRPIHYVVRTEGGPVHGNDMIRSTVARVSVATGLQFTYDGATDQPPQLLSQPITAKGGNEPVLITWATVDEVPGLSGNVAALTGTIPAHYTGGRPAVYAGGEIDVDAVTVGELVQEVNGEQQVRAILLHELGHLVGLDHIDDPSQLMYPIGMPGVVDFASGDLTGLAELGRGACG